MTAVTLVGVAGALLVLAVVIRLVLRGLLNVRYAALWLVVAFVVAILALFPSVLDRLAHTLGFAVPSNLLFFSAIVFLSLVAIQLSIAISALDARVQRLAEELALLVDHDTTQRRPVVDESDGDDPSGPVR